MRRTNFQKAGSLLGLALIALSFAGLGVWQWNRAQESRKPVVVSKNIVALETLTQPRTALPAKATLRLVRTTGTYVGQLQAPHQVDGLGNEAVWDVGLFQTANRAVILVVRGFWSERPTTLTSGRVELIGKLMPHQSDDYAEGSDGVLRRLDSSVIVGQRSEDLYDGYLIAQSETINGAAISRTRIDPPAPRSAVPGFYWQHLSYVIIWWFMAGLVLYLPFYQRRVAHSESTEFEESAEKEEAHG